MINQEFKNRVLRAVEKDRDNYTSDAKQAVALGINAAQLSRIKKGEIDGVLSDANWVGMGRRLNVFVNERKTWNTAKTPVYEYIYEQLSNSQDMSISGLLCDVPDIGKTHTARDYVRKNRHATYIDCSQVKSKQKLIKQIAKEFGVGNKGRYADIYEDLVYYLRSIQKPLIILDEVGDLEYAAFLELKALWNATERFCSFYMMGADGLKAKMEKHRANKKVGYAEIFSRFGNRYQKVTPEGKEAFDEFSRIQLAMVVKANAKRADIQKIYAKTKGSLRRAYTEIQKSHETA